MSSNDRVVTVLTAGGAGRPPPQSSSNNNSRRPSSSTVVSPPPPPPPTKSETHPATNVVEEEEVKTLEYEQVSDHYNDDDDAEAGDTNRRFVPYSDDDIHSSSKKQQGQRPHLPSPPPPPTSAVSSSSIYNKKPTLHHDMIWLIVCFLGIMASFVCYGLLLEYTTSGGRQLHELSFLFVTSGLYTLTAAAGRYVRDETPTTIPPARFAVLGLTSMGSTFCSVRSLRYVIYPIQVLAKSCKPVPVMLMGALMGKRYPLRKYVNVIMIVIGVALFMSGKDSKKHSDNEDEAEEVQSGNNELLRRILNAEMTASSSPSQLIGILLLFVSLCFDGGTGAYEDKLMSVHSVQPFDLMYNIQLGKTILAGIGLLVLNQLHIFLQMVQDMGFLLVALGLSGALGQVFIFVTIAKFGALTCSIIGLARKVTTLVASIYFYGHSLNSVQFSGLVISVTAMVMNFWGKKKGPSSHGHSGASKTDVAPEELEKMLDEEADHHESGHVELAPVDANTKPSFY